MDFKLSEAALKYSDDGKKAYLDPTPDNPQVILFLHGLGASSSMWQYQLADFCDTGYRPIAVDFPGFGKSSPLPRWTADTAAKWVVDLLDELNIKEFHVVGLSMGGVIAQVMALKFPTRVSKLVLCSTFAVLHPRGLSEIRYLLKRFLLASLRGVKFQAEMVAGRVFPAPDQALFREEAVRQIINAHPKTYRSAMRMLAFYDSRSKISHLKAPTLVMGGALDTTVPLSLQMEMCKLIPGAKWRLIPNANHATAVDQPLAFNQTVLEFLFSSDAAPV